MQKSDETTDALSSTEMVRRVGIAMADSVAMNYDHNEAIFNRYARAAIEAMREPTVEMIDAACVAQIDLYPAFEGQKPHPTAGEVIGTCHRAMIDAALGK